MPLRVRLADDVIHVGRHVRIHFQRTLRLPDDGKTYPLPAGLGSLPLRRVADFRRRVPRQWLETGGFFMPMHQHEAMWMCFSGAWWRPNALKVSVGGVNAVSGLPHDRRLRRAPQDYVVVPEQP